MEAKPVNRVYHAMLFKGDDAFEVHHFTMEADPDASRYRAVTSYNAFHEREAEKAGTGYKPGIIRAHVMNQREWEHHLRFEQRAFRPEPTPTDLLPEFTHTSIWDFYKAIGYDYKAKRYTRTDA